MRLLFVELFIFLYRPPVFGWKDDNYNERIDNHKCMISQDIGYQIFATRKAFSKKLFDFFPLKRS